MEKEKLKLWRKRLSGLLKEHPDFDGTITGKIEINLNVGGANKVYMIKKKTKGNTIIYEKTELK